MPAAEKIIHEGKLEAQQVSQLYKAHETKVREQTQGPAGWHGVDDIETLIGLEGRFLWAENPFPCTIHFKFDAGYVGSQGTYTISTWSGAGEQGTFHCTPNNPAIGWASILLLPQGTTTPRIFVVAGMETDSKWNINIMLLNKLGHQGLQQPAFPAIRTL